MIETPLTEEQFAEQIKSLIPPKYRDETDLTYYFTNPTSTVLMLIDGKIYSNEIDIEDDIPDTWTDVLDRTEEDDLDDIRDGYEPDWWDVPEEPEDSGIKTTTTFTFADEWKELENWEEATTVTYGTFLNPKRQIVDELGKKSRYLADLGKTVPYPAILMVEPEMEQLYKAGYEFAKEFLHAPSAAGDIGILHRICRQGTNPKDIFRIKKDVYKALKDEANLNLWASYLTMYEKSAIKREDIPQLRERGYTVGELKLLHSFTSKPEDISVHKVMHYIDRVMQTGEYKNKLTALQEFSDALRMAKNLGIKYNLKRYNLKKQHNDLAKLIEEKEDERLTAGFKRQYEILKEYAKEDDTFLIRPVKDQKDLNNEKSQQRNCVSDYAKDYADGKKMIFFLRYKSEPDVSYVTVEIDPETGVILQAFLADNAEITDEETISFLREWEKEVHKEMTGRNLTPDDIVVDFDTEDDDECQ